ncbi:MAG: hypothetical protein FOGNACKC_00461 [Anaerolineae bacterium]|nr:hypothetical protein [Anaerolineae bacterium]
MIQLTSIARRWLPAVAVLALAGCGAATTPADTSRPGPTPTEPVAAATPTDTPPPPTIAPTDTPVPEPPAAMPEFRPSTRTALAATDPATVALASGKVQLVEFFAFW